MQRFAKHEAPRGASLMGQYTIEAATHRRLAREIHDTVATHFVSANLLLGKVQRRSLDDEVRRSLDELNGELTQALRDLRSFCFLLDAPPPTEGDLHPSLCAWTRGFADRASLDLTFECKTDGRSLSGALQAVVLRIVQEALVNVARHAEAECITVRVLTDGDRLTVEISDDGMGFSASARSGVGLSSMIARARELEGDCQISTSRSGTTVFASLPFPA